LVVVLSSAKDLDLIVILNGVKNLVLFLKGFYPRFFRPSAFRMTPVQELSNQGRMIRESKHFP